MIQIQTLYTVFKTEYFLCLLLKLFINRLALWNSLWICYKYLTFMLNIFQYRFPLRITLQVSFYIYSVHWYSLNSISFLIWKNFFKVEGEFTYSKAYTFYIYSSVNLYKCTYPRNHHPYHAQCSIVLSSSSQDH